MAIVGFPPDVFRCTCSTGRAAIRSTSSRVGSVPHSRPICKAQRMSGSAFMSKSVWRSICHYRPKQYPLMLTGHNSLIHGGLLAQLKPVTIVAADAGRAPPSQCINDICRASSRSQNDPRSCAGKSVQGSHLARGRWSCGMTIERIGSSCTGPRRAAPVPVPWNGMDDPWHRDPNKITPE